jgi:uncharacterized protein (DUF58 family)
MSATQVSLHDLLSLRLLSRQIDLSSRRRVLTDLAGTHLSGFRGRGFEFDDFRAYQTGDDVRTIDWRVSARTSEPHIRLLREERERPMLFAIDFSPSQFFATRGKFKSVVCCEAVAALAWAAQQNGDRVGAVLFGQANNHTEIRPAGGSRGVTRLLKAMVENHQVTAPAAADHPPLIDALKRLRRSARPGSVVAIVSDFKDWNIRCERELLQLSRHCEVLIGFVSDPFERELPNSGRYPVEGTGFRGWLQTGKRQQASHSQAFEQRREALRRTAIMCRAHWLELDTATPTMDSLKLALGRRG